MKPRIEPAPRPNEPDMPAGCVALSAVWIVIMIILSILAVLGLATVEGAEITFNQEIETDWRAAVEDAGYTPLPESLRVTPKADATCPIFVPEEEVWEVYYSVATNQSAPWDECARHGWWSGWHELAGPGVYDLPDLLPNVDFENVIFIIWLIRPLVSCEWLPGPAVGGDCTRETAEEDPDWVFPQWYVVCPDWDAAPRNYEACVFDDGFESGDTDRWSNRSFDPFIFSDGFESGTTDEWSEVVKK